MKRTGIVLIGLCFLISGFSGLVYQAAWSSYLSLVFGASHIAVAVVLAAYMFGMAVGAYLVSKLLGRIQRPVLVYGLLEGLIAVSALLVPFFISYSQVVYVDLFGGQIFPASSSGPFQSMFFLMASFLVLFVPTMAMGATLPLLARYVVSNDDEIGAGTGLLYGLNTVGAVCGVVVSGFLLLPIVGLRSTTYVAMAGNALIFFLVIWRANEYREASHGVVPSLRPPGFHPMYVLVMFTGVISFALEVFWTRLLSHVMGGTSYAFAVMLASFLSGIAIGSLFGGILARSRKHAHVRFAIAHALMVVSTAATYLLVCLWTPDLSSGTVLRGFYAFLVLFPTAVILGATFPLAVRAVSPSAAIAAACSGRVYAWNTMGAIFGALLSGFYLLPQFGFDGTIRAVLIAGGCLSVLASLSGQQPVKRLYVLPGVMLLLAVLLIPVPRPSSILLAHISTENTREVFYAVGQSSTVMLHRDSGFYKLASNGLSESAIGSLGMPPFQLSQKWLSGLPALARPEAQDLLIVGLGGGIALQGVPPHIRSVDVIELEPKVLKANEAVSETRTSNPLNDPRVRVTLNDARNALSLTAKQYDIVISQPSHPWVGGASQLYTREFLSLAKARMRPSAVFLQWINAQFIDVELLRVMASTLQSEFEFVELYQPERQVLMFLASNEPISLWDGEQNVRRALANSPAHFLGMGMRAAEDALVMLAFDTTGIRHLAEGRRPNTDDQNVLAYRARPRGDGLTADALVSEFSHLDPLLTADSSVHLGPGYWSLPYIAERLLQANFVQRVRRMASVARDPSMGHVIDGFGFEYTGDVMAAEAAFRKAINLNERNLDAVLGLLRLHLGDFASRRLAPDLASLANRVSGPSRSALEGWVFGAARDFDQLKLLDQKLAKVDPRSQLYPVAVKLRADWRVWFAQRDGDTNLALEGLELLDLLLASYWNVDLYLLRAACAEEAGRPYEMVESYAAAASQVQTEILASGSPGNFAMRERLAVAERALRRSAKDLAYDPILSLRISEILRSLEGS